MATEQPLPSNQSLILPPSCAAARCQQHRRVIRKQLNRWSKNVLYLVGKCINSVNRFSIGLFYSTTVLVEKRKFHSIQYGSSYTCFVTTQSTIPLSLSFCFCFSALYFFFVEDLFLSFPQTFCLSLSFFRLESILLVATWSQKRKKWWRHEHKREWERERWVCWIENKM